MWSLARAGDFGEQWQTLFSFLLRLLHIQPFLRLPSGEFILCYTPKESMCGFSRLWYGGITVHLFFQFNTGIAQ